jgi:hypothetical protein
VAVGRTRGIAQEFAGTAQYKRAGSAANDSTACNEDFRLDFFGEAALQPLAVRLSSPIALSVSLPASVIIVTQRDKSQPPLHPITSKKPNDKHFSIYKMQYSVRYWGRQQGGFPKNLIKSTR